LEDLESEKVEFKSAEEFLLVLKKAFRKGDEKLVNIAELRKIEQGERTMKKFVQELRVVGMKKGYW